MNMIMATENNQRDQAVLTGTRVLVVGDEFYIADDLNRALTGAGATVVGPLASVSKAEEAVQSRSFDCAILDLNLRGESAVSIAEHLLDNRIPFAIATGYGSPAVPEHLREVFRIEKPFDPSVIVDIVGRLRRAEPSHAG